MCLEPSRTTVNPAFSGARTARRCGVPGSFGTRLNRDFHFSHVRFLERVRHRPEILPDGVPNVIQRLGFGHALGPATRQSGTGGGESFFRREQSDSVSRNHFAFILRRSGLNGERPAPRSGLRDRRRFQVPIGRVSSKETSRARCRTAAHSPSVRRLARSADDTSHNAVSGERHKIRTVTPPNASICECGSIQL